jgi:hypothetical protein
MIANIQNIVNAYHCPTPSWFEMLPSIINYLTYIEESFDKESGKTRYFRKRLTNTDIGVYRAIHQRAGQGKCFASTATLEKQAACGDESVTKAKRIFQMPFEQLGGSPLIHLEERYIFTTDEDGGRVNKRPQHFITPANIWAYNNAFKENLPDDFPEMSEELTKEQAALAIEKMGQQSLFEIVHKGGADPLYRISLSGSSAKPDQPPGGSSAKSDILKPHISNPLIKEPNPPLSAVEVSIKKILLSEDEVQSGFVSEQKAMEWMESFGINKAIRTQMLSRPLEELIASARYTRLAMQKKTEGQNPVTDPTGYYVETVKRRWWRAAAKD